MKEKIGVYVCHCGSNIAGTVDVEQVARWAGENLDEVVVAKDYHFMCSSLGQQLVEEDIKEHGLPQNALHELRYPTVGCTQCTKPVRGGSTGDYSRAGRWSDAERAPDRHRAGGTSPAAVAVSASPSAAARSSTLAKRSSGQLPVTVRETTCAPVAIS